MSRPLREPPPVRERTTPAPPWSPQEIDLLTLPPTVLQGPPCSHLLSCAGTASHQCRHMSAGRSGYLIPQSISYVRCSASSLERERNARLCILRPLAILSACLGATCFSLSKADAPESLYSFRLRRHTSRGDAAPINIGTVVHVLQTQSH